MQAFAIYNDEIILFDISLANSEPKDAFL